MAEKKNPKHPTHGRRRRGRKRPHSGAQPVPLSKRSGSHFQPGDRQRGAEVFRAGSVRLEVDGARARARVEGRQRQAYGVGLDWSRVSDRVLHAFCECRRFASGRPCKHLWATLLALAETEPNNQPPGRGRLSLRKDRATNWRDLGITAIPDPARPDQARPGRRGQQARPGRGRPAPRNERGLHAAGHSWRSQLAAVREEVVRLSETAAAAAPSPRHKAAGVRFLINTAASLGTGGLVLDIFGPKSGAARAPGKLKRTSLDPEELEVLLRPEPPAEKPAEEPPAEEPPAEEPPAEEPPAEEPLAKEPPAPPDGLPVVVAALPAEPPGRRGRGKPRPARLQRFRLPRELYGTVLPHLCSTGTLGWWDGRAPGDPRPLSWDAGPPWHLVLRLEVTVPGDLRLRGCLERESESLPLSAPVLILPGGGGALVLFAESIARLEATPERDLPWITLLRGKDEIVIPKEDLEEALTSLLEIPSLPRLEAPEELRLVEERAPAQPRLVLEPDVGPEWMPLQLLADLSFVYGSLKVSAGDPRPAVVDWQERRFVRRDMAREHGALVRLLELGLQPVASGQGHSLELNPRDLPAVAEPLLLEGWEVESHGTSLRPPSPPALRVESGVDWFELRGSIDFAGDEVELAAVLDAISRGRRLLELGDGSQGLLPAAWMETYDSLAKLAHSSTETGLRFLPSQALLVDALLTAMPPANVDRAFAELRQKLSSFDRVKPKKEPRGFGGTLRGYQRQGLGWLEFLREFGLGGVLADDMGLGKTVQVLALLKANRTPSKTTGIPFLVVAPRSLVYNWIDEAARFTPKLRVVEYGGPDREELRDHLTDYDLVVTTYGTLRRDVAFLATVELDTVILDEAQAIKNPASQTAKASGLLVARHRLALTGTPIENHLGELGSLFEFLNPGLLGRLPRLDALAAGRAASKQELEVVAEGVRPFILRRTKAQVLPDLPPKTEQVLLCTLRPSQRELYDKVLASYRASLLHQVERKGVSGSAIQVLEALLRLRQVACHPGLVEEDWEEAGSAKLEALFEQVAEVLDEGHKVLVFSQFTKLLAYVTRHLDEQKVAYAYLDGQTRNRGELVERFQTDPDCNLFVISLKAGGLGLNLTAAGYVFLLDPWWNPAVEAQAIDRAHRIGQTQPVFAYRMIARDTVEEKILELQRSKRQIADAILGGGEGQSLRDLTAEDLRMLLS